MNRTAKAIRMLEILQVCGQMSKKELARRLEINERNVYELKKELLEAGFRFKELKGRNSGYELDKQYLLKLPSLSKEEKEAIISLTYQLKADEKYIGLKETHDALLRISSQFDSELHEKNTSITYSSHKSEDRDQLQETFTMLNYAIKEHYQVEVFYDSYYHQRMRIINPYDLFSVDHEWYWSGYETDTQMFKLYKLDRTKSITVSSKNYWVDPAYRRDNFVDENGLKNFGKEVRVKLRISGAYIKSIKENPVGRDVEIKDLEDAILYQATIRGDYKLQELIFKMGTNCMVIEPIDLKNSVIEKLKMMLDQYGKMNAE